MSHPIENIMKTTMEELRQMVDVNTVVGNPIITSDNTLVLPVSKLSLGFLSGGGEYTGTQGKDSIKKAGELLEGKSQYPFAGTAAAGISITPMGFLSVRNEAVRMTQVRYDNSLERAIDRIPDAIRSITEMLEDIRKKENEEEQQKTPMA